MRPVEKKKPGDIVRYTDSNDQEVEHTIQVDYPNYGDAKFPLASNIGQYCSYCEGDEKIHSLEVEHMAAKSKGGSPTAWNNFLLCCKIPSFHPPSQKKRPCIHRRCQSAP